MAARYRPRRSIASGAILLTLPQDLFGSWGGEFHTVFPEVGIGRVGPIAKAQRNAAQTDGSRLPVNV